MMRDTEDWSALPDDVLGCIGSCLDLLEDFNAFKGVCTSWRSAATDNKDKFVSKVPLLMLAEKDGTDEREFYSLSKHKICTRIPLPDANGNRCVDAGFGWILVLSCSNKGEACLLNPFSSARIQLPNFTQAPEYENFCTNPAVHFFRRGWLTANPSETSDFSLVVLMAKMSTVGFWRNGDLNWTKTNTCSPILTCCNGKIYILDLKDHVLIWEHKDLISSEPKGLVVDVDYAPNSLCSLWCYYLVGSSAGELRLIRRNNTSFESYRKYGTNRFDIWRVDLVQGACRAADDLGDDAIFIGHNAAVSVDATEFPGVLNPNCIYFTDDLTRCFYYHRIKEGGGGKDMGVYNVKDESVERFGVKSFSRVCPPLWLFPSGPVAPRGGYKVTRH